MVTKLQGFTKYVAFLDKLWYCQHLMWLYWFN